jgi:GH25 family lysozyme M1 (1,4-beta-N-acetylmuramidase)
LEQNILFSKICDKKVSKFWSKKKFKKQVRTFLGVFTKNVGKKNCISLLPSNYEKKKRARNAGHSKFLKFLED